jgi:hypothetical protein
MRYGPSWRLLTYRFSDDASWHRLGDVRELRRVGAVSLQEATWAFPPGDGFDQGVGRAVTLVQWAGGRPLLFEVTPSTETATVLKELFTAEREAESAEFVSEAGKAEAERRREMTERKFTLAEME